MGDIQECKNYRGIKLPTHTFKIWERVLDRQVRECTDIYGSQFGFIESDTGERKRGRPKTRWKDVCKRDMQTVGLREGDEGDRAY